MDGASWYNKWTITHEWFGYLWGGQKVGTYLYVEICHWKLDICQFVCELKMQFCHLIYSLSCNWSLVKNSCSVPIILRWSIRFEELQKHFLGDWIRSMTTFIRQSEASRKKNKGVQQSQVFLKFLLKSSIWSNIEGWVAQIIYVSCFSTTMKM